MNKEKWVGELTNHDYEIWSEDFDGKSREEVIKIGTKLAKEEGLHSFRIGRVQECGMSTICVDNVLDSARDELYDTVGEVSEDYLNDLTNEQEKELEDALNEVFYQWHKKHDLFPKCYQVLDDEVIEVEVE